MITIITAIMPARVIMVTTMAITMASMMVMIMVIIMALMASCVLRTLRSQTA